MKSENPSPSHRKKIILVCMFTTLLTALLLVVACTYEPRINNTANYQPLVPEAVVNPEVQILAKYMKLRNSKLPIEIAELQAQAIIDTAASERLPVELLVGIAETESTPPFNPFSESSVGAAGLMQIYQAPNVEISQEQRFDIKYNLEVGSIILKGKLELTGGDLTKALGMYSGHAGNYAPRVYECVGRYSMFRAKVGDSVVDEIIELAINTIE